MWLCVAAQKGLFVMKYYGVLSPTAPAHPSVLPQAKGQKQNGKMERRKRRVERQNIRRERKQENERSKTRERLSYVMLTVVKGGEIWD